MLIRRFVLARLRAVYEPNRPISHTGPAPRVLCISIIAFALGCSSAQQEQAVLEPHSDARRTVAQGTLIGGQDLYNSHSWLGIPYTRPPVGNLRWRAPAAPEAWSGERPATRFGAACTQLASPLGGAADLPIGSVRGSEDCLTLNVYAPRLAPNELPTGRERLPVVLWIHGGANRAGSADFYHGGNLAATHNLLVVTVNYRLGPFGWFHSPELARAGASRKMEASGNFALLDLIAALRWLRENAAAFGGDPGRITIMGESAGANNVLGLLLSPRAKGLFHRAIMQSAFPRFTPPRFASGFISSAGEGSAAETQNNQADASAAVAHPNSSGEIIARLLLADGKAPNIESARASVRKLPPRELAEYLRAQSAERIIDAYRQNLSGENARQAYYEFPSLFKDGHLLPQGDLARQLRAGGSAATVPLLIGANRDEDNLYLAIDEKFMRRYFGLIPSIPEPEFYDAMGDHLSASWRILGLHRPARAIRAVNPRVFAYRFDWDEEPTIFGTDLSLALGAAHAFEVPFAFGHFRLGAADRYMFTNENLPGRLELSDAMMEYWAQFARNGRPGRGAFEREIEWKPYGRGEELMILDTQAGGGRRMQSQPIRRDDLLKAIESDPRLKADDRRCQVLRRMVRFNRMLKDEELRGLNCP